MTSRAPVLTGLAALSGFVAVAAGAFGAHGVADPVAKAWLETGGHYQMIHALVALVCAEAGFLAPRRAALTAGLFLTGGAIFGGTLYAMGLGAPRILGAVTPIGGLALLAGWALLAWSAFAARRADGA